MSWLNPHADDPISDHAALSNLDFASAGHVGVLLPVNGGTGQDSSAWTGVPKVAAGIWSSGAVAADVGASALGHTHPAADITSGTLDGDRLPGLSASKRGGAPATGVSSGLFLRDDDTWAAVGVPTTITVANEAADTTCFPLFVTAATGDLGPKTNAGLTFDSSTARVGLVAATISTNSTTALLVEQDGVKDNVLVVDTTNGRITTGNDIMAGGISYPSVHAPTGNQYPALWLADQGVGIVGQNVTSYHGLVQTSNLVRVAGDWKSQNTSLQSYLTYMSHEDPTNPGFNVYHAPATAGTPVLTQLLGLKKGDGLVLRTGNDALGYSGGAGYKLSTFEAFGRVYLTLSPASGTKGVVIQYNPTDSTNAYDVEYSTNNASLHRFMFIWNSTAHNQISESNGATAAPIIFKVVNGSWDTGTANLVMRTGYNSFYKGVAIGVDATPASGGLLTMQSASGAGGNVSAYIKNTTTSGYSVLRLGTIAEDSNGDAIHHFGSTWSPGVGSEAWQPNSMGLFAGLGNMEFVAYPAGGLLKFYSEGTATANEVLMMGSSGSVFNEPGADRDLRVEGDTATNLLVCDAGLDAVQIGTTTAGAIADFRATTIDLKQDTYWTGSGSGLPYGSCYGNEIGWTQAAAAQNTWYAVSDADMADGQLNLVTHDGNGALTVSKAGRYEVTYNTCVEVSLPNTHIQTGIGVTPSGGSLTAQNDGINHVEVAMANAQMPVGGNATLSLAASSKVEVIIRTTDAGTPDLAVDHINLTLHMVGG